MKFILSTLLNLVLAKIDHVAFKPIDLDEIHKKSQKFWVE